MKYDYKIVCEIPRELRLKNGSEMTVDQFTTFVYGRKNKESALRKFGSVENLRNLRRQGFSMTRAEFKKYRNKFLIERV
jgi:hypothetical protein